MRKFTTIGGFSLVELLLATAILALLMAVALRMYQPAISKAEVANAFYATGEQRLQVHEHYAVTGEWLESRPPWENEANTEKFGPSWEVVIDQGAVTVRFDGRRRDQLGGTDLSLRPVVVPNGEGVAFLWACGYADISPGLEVGGVDRSDIAAVNLPWLCR